MGAAQYIFTLHIQKSVTEHVERRACMGAMVQKNRNRIIGFLDKNACPKTIFRENNFFAAVIRQIC